MTPYHYIFFHKNCSDGLLAGTLTRQALLASGNPGPIAITPIKYNKEVEALAIITSRTAPQVTLWFVDFCPPAKELDRLQEQLRLQRPAIRIFDHHKTATERLKGWEPGEQDKVILDNERAGCQIVWDYFFPGSKQPPLLQEIGWRDLGGPWEDGADPERSSRAHRLNSGLQFLYQNAPKRLTLNSPASWQETFHACDTAGRRLNRAESGVQKAAAADSYDILLPHTELIRATHAVPVSQSSQVCHSILETHPDTRFAAVYFQKDGRFTFSLRSRNGDREADCAALAERYGGGGHRHAAGFTLDSAPLITGS